MQVYLERDAFSRRLREALERVAPQALLPAALAREFNRRYPGTPVTLHAARKWLGGEALPAQDKLRVLAAWLCVTAEWLRFGGTETAVVPPESGPMLDFQLARDIATLSDAHQQVVRDMVKSLIQAERSH